MSGLSNFGPLVGSIDEGTSSARFMIFKVILTLLQSLNKNKQNPLRLRHKKLFVSIKKKLS